MQYHPWKVSNVLTVPILKATFPPQLYWGSLREVVWDVSFEGTLDGRALLCAQPGTVKAVYSPRAGFHNSGARIMDRQRERIILVVLPGTCALDIPDHRNKKSPTCSAKMSCCLFALVAQDLQAVLVTHYKIIVSLLGLLVGRNASQGGQPISRSVL